MGKVSNVVKKMTQEQILAFEKSGEISFFGHCLKLEDIKVMFHKHAVLGLIAKVVNIGWLHNLVICIFPVLMLKKISSSSK